jgi:hypothetical protein
VARSSILWWRRQRQRPLLGSSAPPCRNPSTWWACSPLVAVHRTPRWLRNWQRWPARRLSGIVVRRRFGWRGLLSRGSQVRILPGRWQKSPQTWLSLSVGWANVWRSASSQGTPQITVKHGPCSSGSSHRPQLPYAAGLTGTPQGGDTCCGRGCGCNVPIHAAHRRDCGGYVFGGGVWINAIHRSSGPESDLGRVRRMWRNQALPRTNSTVDGTCLC